jgi:hypothetical protein
MLPSAADTSARGAAAIFDVWETVSHRPKLAIYIFVRISGKGSIGPSKSVD